MTRRQRHGSIHDNGNGEHARYARGLPTGSFMGSLVNRSCRRCRSPESPRLVRPVPGFRPVDMFMCSLPWPLTRPAVCRGRRSWAPSPRSFGLGPPAPSPRSPLSGESGRPSGGLFCRLRACPSSPTFRFPPLVAPLTRRSARARSAQSRCDPRCGGGGWEGINARAHPLSCGCPPRACHHSTVNHT